MRDYFDRKQAVRVKRREGRKKRFKLFVMLMVLAGAAWGLRLAAVQLSRRDSFAVRNIVVHGNKALSCSDVSAQAGNLLGKACWKIDEKALIRKLMQKFPAVKKAGICAWPWGTMVISISERQPVAKLAGDPNMSIDEDGVVFPDSAARELPEIRIAGTNETGRRRGINLIMAGHGLEAGMTVDPECEDNMVLCLDNGTRVSFGNGGFDEKYRRFQELRQDLDNNGSTAAEIDLRFKDQAVATGVQPSMGPGQGGE
jgi:cell division septal protein FtsQ